MQVEVFDTAADAATAAAMLITAQARQAAAEGHPWVLALSGGSTPRLMLQELARQDLPWDAVQVFQVDERVAPAGHAERNDTMIRELLIDGGPLAEANYHPMPVEAANLDSAIRHYAQSLSALAGTPPALDLAHLGLGGDGHTASLFPGDPVLQITDRSVAMAGEQMGRRRMTLTYPVLAAAKQLLWLVTGAGKAAMLARLRAGDQRIPAGRLPQQHARVFADREAVGKPPLP